MVVSTINLADFTESGGNAEEIHGVMDELLANAPSTDVVLLLAETAKNKITGKLKGMNGADVLVIAEAFGGSGHVLAAGFDMPNATLSENKKIILDKVRAIRDKQLGRVAKNQESRIKNQESDKKDKTPVIASETKQSMPLNVAQDDNDFDDTASLNEFAEDEITPDEDFANEQDMAYEEIFTPEAVTTANEDEITQAIKSIDDEIEGVLPETPNIDVEDNISKKATLQQIGEVIRGYNPGQPIEEKGEQPVDANVWK
jgi:hypothetical protein